MSLSKTDDKKVSTVSIAMVAGTLMSYVDTDRDEEINPTTVMINTTNNIS